jgi:hypothetical protein
MIDHGLEGRLEFAIVKSVEPEKFRGVIKSLDTGSLQKCIMNPSPYGGIMPIEGALVAVYRKQGWWARYLFPVSEMVDTGDRSIDQRLEEDFEEPLGDMEPLDSGESFYGRFGRLRFDNQGSVLISSQLKDISLKLSHQIKRAELTANDFMFSTHGAGIRVWTKGSVPTTYGDTIRIEKNVATVTIPKEISKIDAPVPNISYFEIDKVGGMTMSAILGGAKLSLSGADITGLNTIGLVSLKNTLSELSLSPIGDIELLGPLCEFSMSATAEVFLSNKVGSLTISPAGIMNVSSKADMTLNAGTSLAGFAETVNITANALAHLNGAMIKLGVLASNHATMAEPLALIMTAMTALNVIVITHTHLVATVGGPTAQAGTAAPSLELAAAASALPLALAPVTAAAIGSLTVQVQN